MRVASARPQSDECRHTEEQDASHPALLLVQATLEAKARAERLHGQMEMHLGAQSVATQAVSLHKAPVNLKLSPAAPASTRLVPDGHALGTETRALERSRAWRPRDGYAADRHVCVPLLYVATMHVSCSVLSLELPSPPFGRANR